MPFGRWFLKPVRLPFRHPGLGLWGEEMTWKYFATPASTQ